MNWQRIIFIVIFVIFIGVMSSVFTAKEEKGEKPKNQPAPSAHQ